MHEYRDLTPDRDGSQAGGELDSVKLLLEKLDEIINGTARSGGLKERIAVAEDEIKRNKTSFETINRNISELHNEMLIEVGKMASAVNANAQQRVTFWRDLGQTVAKVALSTITAGVVGVVFWRVIIWLAANAPTP